MTFKKKELYPSSPAKGNTPKKNFCKYFGLCTRQNLDSKFQNIKKKLP